MSSGSTHYDALGVPRDASAAELRRAYLDLARRHHPDRRGGAADAEDRMRAVNAAWAVLGSPDQRASYDRSLAAAEARDGGGTASSTSPIRRPSSHFVPIHDEDEDDDDSWRYEPDEGDPASAPPQPLLAAPPLVFAAGFVVLAVGLVASIDLLVAIGLIGFAASLLLFLGAPVVALFRSRSTEERASRRR